MQRVTWSKVISFVCGLLSFVLVPFVWPDVSVYMQWGMLLWMVTIGGVIGVAGLFTTAQPLCAWTIPSFFRGAMLGGVMVLMFVLVGYDAIKGLMDTTVVFQGVSPFYIIINGVIFGALLDFFVTHNFGEGEDLLQ